ncbi:universal stress protein [Haloarcula amylovorans]|uniref:universal stress protein n=1 Tax=Haloarcula amylovorans TaxID=2562280 RepID=UPI001ADDAB92|nr:universal stress protein [Halomicroarcula amylolytica]
MKIIGVLLLSPWGLAAETILGLLGDATKFNVVLLYVFKQLDAADEGGYASSEYEESDLPESVTIAMDVLEEAGVTVTKRHEHGDPAETILDVASEIEADLISISGRKRSPQLGKWFSGA